MEAAGLAVSCTSLSITMYKEIIGKDQNNPTVQELETKIESGWNRLEKVGELELQKKKTNSIAKAIKSLTEWCYEAEDLVDKHQRNEQGSSSIPTKIMDSLSKRISRNKTKKLGISGDGKLKDFDESYKFMFGDIENNNIQRPRTSDISIRCFAYLALFPDTLQFTIEYLVHLWIGECFIPSTNPISLKQDEENDLFHLKKWLIPQPLPELYRISQNIPRLSASQICLQLGQGDWNEITRHLSYSSQNVFNNNSWSTVPDEKKKKIRTFLSLCNEHNNAGGDFLQVPPNFCNTVPRLRVLSLKGLNIEMIPRYIEKLKHLRYLDISFTHVKILTKEFHQLQALMFLKIKGTKFSKWLDDFHKLTNLIYVDWDESDLRRIGMPCSIGKLSKLQSLPLFKVGDKEGYLIGELKEMNKLQGTLQIMDLQRVKSYEEATKAMLKDKRDLTTIILEWNSNSNSNGSAENVLRGLELHENVKELKLIEYDGEKFPDWIKDSCLEKIHLKECRSLDSFFELGKLKKLKTLILENMESKSELSCRSSGDTQAADPLFPALESLELYNLTELQKMTGLRTGDMPWIRKFKAAGCTEIADLFANFAPGTADLALKQVIKSIFENKGWGHTLEIKIVDVKRKNGKITEFVEKIDIE